MNQDQAIIKETLEEVKAALAAVVKAAEMKQNRFGLWLKCKEALDHLEDAEPGLERLLAPLTYQQKPAPEWIEPEKGAGYEAG
jgi:hypothetical protein